MACPWRTIYKILLVDADDEHGADTDGFDVIMEEEAILRAPTVRNLPSIQSITIKITIVNVVVFWR